MLQPTEQSRIRTALGYPDLLRYKSTRLESILIDLSDEALILVRENLASLAIIETKLLAAASQAAIRKVDEIEFFSNGRRLAAELRWAGRMYVSRLSIILGVPLYSDIFSGQGYLGDKYSGFERGGAGFFSVG